MGIFQYVATLSGANATFTSLITDLDLIETEAGTRLYAVTRADGGMSAWNPTGTGAAVELSEQAFRSNYGRVGDPDLVMVSVDGTSYLLPAAIGDTSNSAFFVDDNTGGILGRVRFNSGVSPAEDALLFSTLEIGGRSFVASVSTSSGIPTVYEATNTRSLEVRYSPTAASGSSVRVEAMETMVVDGQAIILTATGTTSTLTAYLMNSVTGAISFGGSVDMSVGIGFTGFTALTTVQFGAAAGSPAFVVAAAAGSSSITVFSITSGGDLMPVDHAVDMLETRFATASNVESFTYGDQVFVLGSGGDDGVSLFQLLPDGHLIYLESISDSNSLPLNNVSAMAVGVVGGRPQLFVSSETEAGIAQFDLNLGARGVTVDGSLQTVGQFGGTGYADLLIAGGTTSRISGGGGDDMLVVDGQNITLNGGDGADRFVMLDASGTVVIEDFQRGVDRLDLSVLVGLYSGVQLSITQEDWGATLRYGSLVLTVRMSDFNPMSASGLINQISLGPAHYEPQPEAQSIGGTLQAETIIGGNAISTIYGGHGNDTLYGGCFADTIFGDNDDDEIYGNSDGDSLSGGLGNDTIYGGEGRDFIRGDAGNDRLFGGDDDDRIYGNAGNDYMDGGNGDDELDGGPGRDTLFGFDGNDLLRGYNDADVIYGGAGNDTIYGQHDSDRMYGEGGNDFLRGDWGDDTLDGGAGNDTLHGGDGNDSILGGSGNDEVRGHRGNDVIFGDDGDDRLFGDLGNDRIDGGDGNDYIVTGHDNDTAFGGIGNDVIILGLGNDRAWGGAGNDFIWGEASDDLLFGEVGDDTLNGGVGNDTVDGGAGNDLLVGDGGADLIRGWAGADTLYGGAMDDSLFGNDGADLIRGDDGSDYIDGGGKNDVIYGGGGNDTVFGGIDGGWDTIYGNAGNDFIDAGGGNDVIFGGTHNDTIIGGNGNDWIAGEAGRDFMTGGAGADVFVFFNRWQSGTGATADRITDFTHGVDHVDLSALNLNWIGNAELGGGQLNALRYSVSGGLGRLQADVNGDGRVDFEIHFDGMPVINLGDLIL